MIRDRRSPALLPKTNWWRRAESEYSAALKIRKLLIFREGEDGKNDKISLAASA
jgi:hypothetical protein